MAGMRTFFRICYFLMGLGLGWLFAVKPVPPAGLMVFKEQVYFFQGTELQRWSADGQLTGNWKIEKPIRQLIALDDQLGWAQKGSDDLTLASPEALPQARIAAPLKAGGQGRWCVAFDRLYFLNPTPSSLWARPRSGIDWTQPLPPEDMPSKASDIEAFPGSLGLLSQDPAELDRISPQGFLTPGPALNPKALSALQRFAFDDWRDYVNPQKPEIPLWFKPLGAQNFLVLFTNPRGTARRLVLVKNEKNHLSGREIFMGSRQASRTRRVRAQDAAALGNGFVVTSAWGGIWKYNAQGLIEKQWLEEKDPDLFWRQTWPGWILLILGFSLAGTGFYFKKNPLRLSREAIGWASASALWPGLGQWAQRRWIFGWILVLSAAFWVWNAFFLWGRVKAGVPVTTATLMESALALALVWGTAILQALLGSRFEADSPARREPQTDGRSVDKKL
jgi:hypothetical protein